MPKNKAQDNFYKEINSKWTMDKHKMCNYKTFR